MNEPLTPSTNTVVWEICYSYLPFGRPFNWTENNALSNIFAKL
jgi:hypothetical protein